MCQPDPDKQMIFWEIQETTCTRFGVRKSDLRLAFQNDAPPSIYLPIFFKFFQVWSIPLRALHKKKGVMVTDIFTFINHQKK